MRRLGLPFALSSALLLTACAVPPPRGPGVMALPPQGKPLQSFQQEDAYCQSLASQQANGADSQAAESNAVGHAVVGTALGAGVGALLGSASGHAGAGAAIGAGAGLLMGGASGAGAAQRSANQMRSRYDRVYTQCMYSYGNSVQSAPGYRQY